MAEKPYKIVTYEPGAANVFDRASGEKLGFVLQGFNGDWTPYTAPGVAHRPSARRDEAAAHLRYLRMDHEAAAAYLTREKQAK